MENKTSKICGLKVDLYDLRESLKLANSLNGQVVTINPEMIEYARNNADFTKILNEAELTIPDGIGVTLALLINGIKTHRVRGIEFAHKLLEMAATDNRPVALVGAKENILEWACVNLKKQIPNLNIAYAHNGYFKNFTEISSELQACQPRVLLMALGSPKQEELIYNLKSVLPNTLMVGVGGSFDVWSGAVKRAPKVFQKLGLEWFYRIVTDPKRIKRIFPTLPMFLFHVLEEKCNDVRKK